MHACYKSAMAGVSLLALSVPVHAQSQNLAPSAPAASSATASDDIIVTARRRDERLQDVPLTVSAVTSEALDRQQIHEFVDVASLVPGLTLTPAPDGVAPKATLRGVNYDVNSSGSNGTVDFYLNDAPISAGVLFQSIYDVAQIEVLHGPQGTLRGLASPSGSVTVTTTRPNLYEFGGYANGTATTIGGNNINGAVNLPIIKGILAVRLAGVYDDTDENRVHSINDPGFRPYARTRGFRATVRFDPVENLDIQGSYEHLIVNDRHFDQVESANLALGTPAVGSRITAGQRQAVEYVPRDIHQGYDTFRIAAEYRFAGQKLNYVGGFERQDIISQYVGDIGDALATPGQYPGSPSANPLTAPNIYNFGQYTNSAAQQQSNELRLSSDERILGIFDYVLGGLINRLNSPTNITSEIPIFGGTVSPAGLVTVFQSPDFVRNRTLERSVFGNVTAHIGSQFELSGGLRHIHFNNLSNLSLSPGGVDDFKANVYSASAKYKINQDIMVYASTGSSWRLGSGTTGIILSTSGQTEPTVTDPNLLALYAFKPETSKSYEIGIKAEFFDKKVLLNLTGFHQDFKNFIYASAPIYFNANVGTLANPVYAQSQTGSGQAGLALGLPVRVNGVEGEIGFRPGPHFNIDAVASYTVSKIENGLVPCNIVNPQTGAIVLPAAPAQINFCNANYSASLTPPFSATVQSEYNQEIYGKYVGFVRGQLTFNGYSKNDPTNPYDDVPAYGLLNAYLGVRDPHGAWDFTLYGKNLFNTLRTLTTGSTPIQPFIIGASATSNYRLITTTSPREFGINLRVAFGSH